MKKILISLFVLVSVASCISESDRKYNVPRLTKRIVKTPNGTLITFDLDTLFKPGDTTIISNTRVVIIR
jgi:hypothetical protein